MLNQLMAIKRRREQGARRRLSDAQAQYKACADKLAKLNIQQKILREAWRASNQQAREVKQYEMQRVQKEFDQFFQTDVQQRQQELEMKKLQTDIDALIEQQRLALQRARVELEKLTYLLEQKN